MWFWFHILNAVLMFFFYYLTSSLVESGCFAEIQGDVGFQMVDVYDTW